MSMTSPTPRGRERLVGAAIVAAILGLPLAGAAVAGRDVRQFFEFPPPFNVPRNYLRFSWLAAAGVAFCVAALVVPWSRALRRVRGNVDDRTRVGVRVRSAFPAWGWVAAGWTLLWWMLAWTRWDWFGPWQPYTFFPLWLGFIVTVNAAAQRRTGSCLLRRAPSRWLALFGASAACWWSFEWLNRFVLNWHYVGAERFSGLGYAFHATLCFSTVLPAVAAVAEWIAAEPRWRMHFKAGPRWGWLQRPALVRAVFVGGGLALFATGVWPTWFYPALWVAPLALLASTPVLLGRRGLADELAAGDWTRAAPWMLAALVCGGFWEMWNFYSDPKWIYTVPGVERWHVFEMPLLGYAGYLPFGLECLLISERVLGREADRV